MGLQVLWGAASEKFATHKICKNKQDRQGNNLKSQENNLASKVDLKILHKVQRFTINLVCTTNYLQISN